MKPLRDVGFAVLAGVTALAGFHNQARACGGFFCDRPNVPTDLPVAQTGENVLFAMDESSPGLYRLEAHIQIFYTGPASRFSWVVPVDALPTLDIGSNAVFNALDLATRPKLMVTRKREGVCSDDQRSIGFAGGASADSNTRSAPGPMNEGGVTVAFHGNVGPFDAVVVKADEPGKLKAWLAENMYYLSDEGSRLIDDYVLEQKYFVALKLLPGKMVNEIQPIVLRFEARGPCVPLRLTAVASLPDLRVNLWVLSRYRIVPENFFEITINEARFDWLGGGSNYQDLLKAAANEAGGNAFAVEYAGTTQPLAGTLVPPGGLSVPQLVQQDPEAMQIAANFQAGQYQGMTLAEVLEAQVLKPRRAAQALFDGHAKLTRLVTFISPDEMKIDPTFIENSTLPDVSNIRTADATLLCGAREYSSCNAPMRISLPDGKSLYFKAPAGDGWCGNPAGDDRGVVDQMPALERGWKREAVGDGALRFDNRSKIGAALAVQEKAVIGGCGCALGGRSATTPLWLLPLGAAALLRRRWRR
jgi:Uncharacterized protein conserved in bacteria (DUF2330)